MTAAVLTRAHASPRDAAFARYALVALAVLALAIVWQSRIGLWGDVVWLLMLDERWFAGARPYIDFLEINPPASLLIYAPEVVLAKAFGVASETVVVVAGFLMTALSLSLAGAILRRAGREIGLTSFAVALAVFLFLPGDAFMERDVLASVFLAPYLALAEARAAKAPVDWRQAALAGLGVGLMAALKPPYALAAGLPALYVLFRAGPRALLNMVEIPVGAGVALGYAFVAWRGFPAYAQNMLPALIDVYLAVRQSAFELLHSEGGLDFVALMIFGALLARDDIGAPEFAVPALAALGAFAGYYAQGKGWLYQAYPALAFASLFAGRGFERSRPDPREVWLALAACAAALGLGLVIERWGFALVIAAGAALAVRRLWLGAPADLTLALARMAAAAFGATAAGFFPGAQPSNALGQALTRLKPHPTVMAVSESFGYVHPMVRRVGAQWVQSVPNLVITSGARLLMDQRPGDAALAARLAPYIEADRQRLISDIRTRKPDAIIVGPLDTRFHAALWADPELQDAMRDYALFAVNDLAAHPGQLWARRDLIGLRPTLEP
jgi:hypothetical protein